MEGSYLRHDNSDGEPLGGSGSALSVLSTKDFRFERILLLCAVSVEVSSLSRGKVEGSYLSRGSSEGGPLGGSGFALSVLSTKGFKSERILLLCVVLFSNLIM